MSQPRLPLGLILVTALGTTALAAACGTTKSSSGGSGAAGSGGAGGSTATGAVGPGGSDGGITLTGTDGGNCTGLDVQPAAVQTITVAAGQMTPTVTWSATLDCNPTAVAWGVDKGNAGSVTSTPSATGVLTPSGTTGGLVTVSASINGKTLTRQVMIKLTATQNGPDTSPGETAQIPKGTGDLTAGGGVGGVGGEGLGSAVSDPATITALGAPSGDGSAQGLKLLYPYDRTVWPRGMLAPLLMWDWSIGDADAVELDITTTTGSFTYSGTFGRPPILAQTGGKFVRMPIPQDVWDMATNTAGGSMDQITVKLTVAKGGAAYGPISETWTVAPGRLSGTIYYNSYGTLLVQNSGGAVGGNGSFGAAVLRIRVGDTAPTVAAGSNSECRTCHSVAANGSRLEAMPYANYSAYDLTPTGSTEHVLPNSGDWFPGVYPDGSMMLTADGQLIPLPNGGNLPISGLPGGGAYMPMFAPDGKHVAFNPGLGSKISVMSFDQPSGAFSAAMTAVDTTGSGLTPGWPAFFPDDASIVFEDESANGYDGHGDGILWTRGGAKGTLAWAPITGGPATPLDNLNGKGYLPKLAAPFNIYCGADGNSVGGIDADHGDDVDLNYEPTVNPVASGGYAWVVFTSRRMYGNEATLPPFCSDPRGVNLVDNITTKKLWVAAVDLTQAPGTDASHPAFYLPAQELLAGNSRGFWALDPCKMDGDSCQSGDQCCNGYCEPNGSNGALVCSSSPPMSSCSGIGDKCSSAADCCDPLDVCLNGFCSLKGPQ